MKQSEERYEVFRMNGQLRYTPVPTCEKCGVVLQAKNTSVSSVAKQLCQTCDIKEANHD